MSLTSGTPVREAIGRPGELCSLQLYVNLNRWLMSLPNAAPYRIFLRVSNIEHTTLARRLPSFRGDRGITTWWLSDTSESDWTLHFANQQVEHKRQRTLPAALIFAHSTTY